MALSDEAGAKVGNTFGYDSFGNLVKGTLDETYSYTGREWDKEAGLYYYRARFYDPLVGKFISKDPIGFDGGDVNLYSYVGQNPVNLTDPSGKKVYFCSKSIHSWVCKDRTCAGLYPKASDWKTLAKSVVSVVEGEIMSSDYESADPAKQPTYCTEMKVSGGCCDQEKFEKCVLNKINSLMGKTYHYSVQGYNCASWAKEIINNCKRQACQE